MSLAEIKLEVKNKKVKRIGRGCGSGRGKTSGRGCNGTGQRKGRKHYIGFQGGNVPYLRKIPKRGFTSPRKRICQIVNLEDIMNRLKGEKEITSQELKRVNLIKDEKKPVKILGSLKSEFSLKGTFKAYSFSKKAKEIIEKGGGKIECLSP